MAFRYYTSLPVTSNSAVGATVPTIQLNFQLLLKSFPIDGLSFLQPLCLNLRSKDKVFGAAGQPQTYDYPNPRGKPNPIDGLTWRDPLKLLLLSKDQFFTSPGQAPKYDWPNPLRPAPGRAAPDFQLQTNPNISPSGKPFKLDDWQNPIPPRYPLDVRGFTLATNPTLYQSGKPFKLDDWQNPLLPRRNPEFTRPVNIGLTTKPFLQTEWPNPMLATVRRPDWIQSTDLNRYPSGKPFKRDDWQNPLIHRRKPDLTDFLLPKNLVFPSGPQFNIQDTPTLAPVIGVYNSAFLLLGVYVLQEDAASRIYIEGLGGFIVQEGLLPAAPSSTASQNGLRTDNQLLSAQSTRDSGKKIKTKLIIFTSNDRKVGD